MLTHVDYVGQPEYLRHVTLDCVCAWVIKLTYTLMSSIRHVLCRPTYLHRYLRNVSHACFISSHRIHCCNHTNFGAWDHRVARPRQMPHESYNELSTVFDAIQTSEQAQRINCSETEYIKHCYWHFGHTEVSTTSKIVLRARIWGIGRQPSHLLG